ncbi:MAG: helix-turn-helix transcriptional regulator [Rickettsiaceae bacterium H1]|nr:helix-turn-helix transcriptional regulator [Rickettsiaceae bacterium H1]
MSHPNKVIVNPTKAQKSSIDVKLGQQIRKLRILRGYSQDAIAKKIGITFQQLQKYERGINRVCVSRLVDICSFFSIRPSYFIDALSGNGQHSLSEDEERFVYDISYDQVENNKEMLSLIRAYKSISNPSVRKKVISLIKSLGEIKSLEESED